ASMNGFAVDGFAFFRIRQAIGRENRLNGPTLLSGSEIGLIRRYVATKYAHLPAARRADIVADAIRRAVFRRLPALPYAWRLELAEELVRRCLVLERRDIRRADVLAVCGWRISDGRLIRGAGRAWAQWEAPEEAAAGAPAGVMAPGSGESARKPASLAAEVRGEPAQATAPEEKGVSHPPSVFSVAGSVPLLPSASEILNASPPSVSESRE